MDAMDGVKKNSLAAYDAVNKRATQMFGEVSSVALLIMGALLIICAVVGFIVYKITRTDLQSVVVVSAPMRLYNMNTSTRIINESLLPPTLNGQEFTYSFWIYLIEYTQVSLPRVIFYRGNKDRPNPIVGMDPNTNRLTFAVRVSTSQLVTEAHEALTNPAKKYMHVVCDYVPLQRWVNITVTVQDTMLTLYLDGEIYTVSNVYDLQAKDPTTVRPTISGTTGSITVGSDNNATTRGYISRLQFCNYAVMPDDVRTIYNAGPTSSSLMTRLGLPSYGVRSPLYKVDGDV